VSAFDDEFGLFGDDEPAPDEERKPTLGARQIATGETIIDDIEPEDERPARRRPSSASAGQRERTSGEHRPYHDRDHGPRTTGDPAVAQARAVELLSYLAKKLVSKPDDVIVAVVDGQRGPVIELEVHPDDFGKVIGKGGRVAQALRTIVRASAEGKVTIDIVDVQDDDEHEADLEHAGDTSASQSETEAIASDEVDEAEAEAEGDVADAVADEAPVKRAPAKKTVAKKTAAKKTAAKKTTAKKSSAAPAKRTKSS
jgi:predicted RNA-binding protein YlqC (UPF0109 family)